MENIPKIWPDPLAPELADPASPEWEKGGRVHNWQNYVGETLRNLWGGLSDETKLAIAANADDQAGREEWD